MHPSDPDKRKNRLAAVVSLLPGSEWAIRPLFIVWSGAVQMPGVAGDFMRAEPPLAIARLIVEAV